MTHFADLTGDPIQHVGWLEAGQPYSRGAATPADVRLLERLVLRTWKPMFGSHGWHDCTLCGRKPADGPIMRNIDGRATLLGGSEIYLPDGEILYSAPTLILHYIEVHEYQPPEAFLRALRAVDPGAPEYHARCGAIAKRAGLL